jgi:hypothetical protein
MTADPDVTSSKATKMMTAAVPHIADNDTDANLGPMF